MEQLLLLDGYIFDMYHGGQGSMFDPLKDKHLLYLNALSFFQKIQLLMKQDITLQFLFYYCP